uniref:Uncharacterized protein n=1 Tax=Triticum urartu TaxID=4572 RepID=A0A8R7R5I6_TRIUA
KQDHADRRQPSRAGSHADHPQSHPLPIDRSPSLDPRRSSTSSSRRGSAAEAPKQFTVITLGRSTTHHLTTRTVATAVPRSAWKTEYEAEEQHQY